MRHAYKLLMEVIGKPSIPQKMQIVLEPLENPQWRDARKVHDWRNHIPETMQSIWDRLSMEARIVAYIFAKQAADREEW